MGHFYMQDWDPFGSLFCDFSVIRGAKVSDSFLVHRFDDLGMEMLPESTSHICYNSSKSCVFV